MRMPLFTALSGFVYALRPLCTPSQLGGFVTGKSRRLLIPLLTVGTSFVLLQALIPGTNSNTAVGDFWKVYVYGLGHFWFLQAIFLILLVVGLADAYGWLRGRRVFVGAIAMTALLSTVVRIPEQWDIFSLNGFFRLLPFFLLGYLFSGRGLGEGGTWRWAPVAVTVVLLTVRAGEVFGWMPLPAYLDTVVGVALGIAAISTVLAFRHALQWRPLARLGYFSFAIYLLHVFGTAPTRMVLSRIGIDSDGVVFVAALAAGLLLPVLFEVTLGRIRWVSWAFLGQKPYERPSWPIRHSRPISYPVAHRDAQTTASRSY